jgi:uncharacterized membrane protein
VLGGIVFAMAGLYLFKYSIEQGWISPPIRVIAAMLAGVGALVSSQRLKDRYEVTAQALSGGGIVVLYAAVWASRALYELVPLSVAFGLMVLVTAVAVVLAVKQDNRLVAYLGLVGGFATPLLLSTGENRPGALFSYVFLLDVALLGVAYLKRWRAMAALALGGTLLFELGWTFTTMESHQVGVAFAVLSIFALLFTLFAWRFSSDTSNTTTARVLQACALLAPTIALVFFAASRSLDVPLEPTAGLLAALLAGVGFLHRRVAPRPDASEPSRTTAGEPQLLLLASGAVAVVLTVAALSRAVSVLATPRFVGIGLGLCAVALLNAVWPSPLERRLKAEQAATWLLGATMAVFLLVALRTGAQASHWPFDVGQSVLTVGLAWLVCRREASGWSVVVGLAAVAVWGIDLLARLSESRAFGALDAPASFGPMVVLSTLLLVSSLRLRFERVAMTVSVGTLAVSCLVSVVGDAPQPPLDVVVAVELLAMVGVLSTIRAQKPLVAVGALVVLGLRLVLPFSASPENTVPSHAMLGLILGGGLVVHVLLLSAGRAFHQGLWGPVAAALVLPANFPGALLRWREAFGSSAQGALPVGLAVCVVVSAWVAQRRATAVGPRGVMWLLAAAATLVAIAVPLQLDNQWVTISWALMAAAYAALWRRFDSRGLKWLALTLLGIVGVRLLVNPWVLSYAPRSGVLFFNWLTYTYLIPAGCLVFAGWALAPLEVSRARGWEKPLYASSVPVGASASFIAAALVVFAWVTLSVFDFFSAESALSLTFDRLPARDVALSLSWLVYAALLLALGLWRTSRAMRWMSLVFMLVSIGKVFLYDLGELKDLYRVASLAGLALCLIVISLAYQRFVFRRSKKEEGLSS